MLVIFQVDCVHKKIPVFVLVLFQVDCTVKEPSMGEYAQPVLGTKSCHEYSDGDRCVTSWNAREWFVVHA